MSIFDQSNQDAEFAASSRPTAGKTLGFFDSFAASWDSQTRAAAQFGIQEAMRNADDEQMAALRKAGVENVPSLSTKADDPMRMFTDMGQDYVDLAKFYQDGGDPAQGERLSAYDAKINEYKKQFPDLQLKTSQEMWDDVRQKAQDAVALDQRNKTFGGQIGSFLGGMAGSMNPNTSPVNLAVAPIGGVGKNVLLRVGEQAGVQAIGQAAQEFNPWDNIPEQRRLLGLDDSPEDAWGRVLQAGIGGAVGQGLGEVLGAGVKTLRNVFRDTGKDIVPAVGPEAKPELPVAEAQQVPPGVVPADEKVQTAVQVAQPERLMDYVHEQAPWSTSRAGRARTVLDMEHMSTRLNDWTGDNAPWQIEPKQDTTPIRPASGQDFELPQTVKQLAREGDINAIMRKVDPETMAKWDNAVSEKQTASVQLAMAAKDADAAVHAQVTQRLQGLNDQIAALDAKIANVGAMKAKKLRAQRADLVTQLDEAAQQSRTTDSSNMAVIRQRLMKADEKMRDLAPLVTRAKVRAQGRWEANGADYEQVIANMRDGKNGFADQGGAEPLPFGRTLQEIVPQLQRVDQLEKPLKQGADAADAVSAVAKEDDAIYTEATDAARSRLKSVLDADQALRENPEKVGELRQQAEDAAKAGDAEKADKLRKQADDLADADKVSVAGYGTKLALDEALTIEGKDGSLKTATLREHLQDMLADEEDLQAVSTCSVA